MTTEEGPHLEEDRRHRRAAPSCVLLGTLSVASSHLQSLGRAATDAAGVTRDDAAVVMRDLSAVAPVVVRSLVRVTVRELNDLDDRGRRVVRTGQASLARAAEALADEIAEQPLVAHLIERIVDQVRWQVVDAVLPVALERLAAEPQQVQRIVQGQSRGMVEELSRAARSRAVDGDEAVDRFVSRLLHRWRAPREGRRVAPVRLPEGVLPVNP